MNHVKKKCCSTTHENRDKDTRTHTHGAYECKPDKKKKDQVNCFDDLQSVLTYI